MAELAENVKSQDIQLPTWEPKGEAHRKFQGKLLPVCSYCLCGHRARARWLVVNMRVVVVIRVGSWEGELHVERHRAKCVMLCLV